MIPKLKMVIAYNDQRPPKAITIGPSSQIAFERKFEMGMALAFSDEKSMKLEHTYYMAWHAAKPGVDFDEWLDSVEGIEVEVDGTTDPTLPVPSDGS